MKRGEKVKIYFKRDGRCYKLFNVIQLGKDGEVDLKIVQRMNTLILTVKENGGCKQMQLKIFSRY